MLPKVLVLEESFHKQSGGGITLYNLFNQWPSDKLLVAANAKLIQQNDTNKCNICYAFNNKEIIYKFPLKIFKKNLYAAAKINNSHQKISKVKNNKSKIILRFIKKIFMQLFDKLGLFFVFEKYHLSNQFKEWLLKQKPDIIYTRLGSLAMMNFVEQMYESTKIPYVIHIMDDWPQTIVKSIILKRYWQKIIDKKFISLIDKAAGLFAISGGMQEEYLKRYDKNFFPFHNPIILNNWEQVKKLQKQKDKIIIVYAGRLGIANSKSTLEFSEVINKINQNFNIEFHIYTSDFNSALSKKCARKKGVKIFPPVSHNKVPELFSSADILFLPIDNDKKSVQYTRLSFPTKASEYMMSGTPILIYAPKDIYLCKHAQQYNWAVVVNDRNELAKQIEILLNNKNLQEIITQNAKNFAKENFNAEKIQTLFKEKMIEAFHKSIIYNN